jgi:arginase family enzyme
MALDCVQFRNWDGLDETKIYRLAQSDAGLLSDSILLAGLDICEINPRRAVMTSAAGKNQTYKIAANLIKKIAFKQ